MTPLVLRTITSVSPDGIPELAGENRRLITVQAFRAQDVGRDAVCQPVTSEEDAVLVLGVLGEDNPTPDLPLTLRCGDSSLTLAPDGSIRLEGSDLGIESTGGIRLNGATLDLN